MLLHTNMMNGRHETSVILMTVCLLTADGSLTAALHVACTKQIERIPQNANRYKGVIWMSLICENHPLRWVVTICSYAWSVHIALLASVFLVSLLETVTALFSHLLLREPSCLVSVSLSWGERCTLQTHGTNVDLSLLRPFNKVFRLETFTSASNKQTPKPQ